MTNEEKINLIGQKVLMLSNNLDKYQSELTILKQELLLLKQKTPQVQQNIITPPIVVPPVVVPPMVKTPEIKEEIPEIKKQEIVNEIPVVKTETVVTPAQQQQQYVPPVQPIQKPSSGFNFEEFIAGKLITIIGIVILVIGLGIGVKYAIDNNMIDAMARIILAYIAGGILLVLALRLKAKFKAFSAVLLSGGMASLYFTTFAAYSIYNMFPVEVAFGIMVIFTVFTVYAATMYSLEVIGIIGLVGAYAVPMLLNNHSGRIHIMLTYMVIINSGILFLSFKKYWRVLNHIAFGLSWLILGGWVIDQYNYEIHMPMIMGFTFAFFIIFYISNMSYKIMKQEKFGVVDVIRLVANSFIFFGIGYGLLNNPWYQDYLGIFTVANALVHLVFSYIVFKNKLLDRKLFYLLIALVLSFITIAVPVQLEGNWVTLFWSAEAVLLFSIGRYKEVRFYEWLSFVMVLFSLFSLCHDWSNAYYNFSYLFDDTHYIAWVPFVNIHMFTSLFVLASLGTIIFVHHKKTITEEIRTKFNIYTVIEYAMPCLLFIFTYISFANEITTFFTAKYQQSGLKIPSTEAWAEPGAFNMIYDENWRQLKGIASNMYTVLFFIVISILTWKRWNNNVLRWFIFGMNLMVMIIFLSSGLNELSGLRSDLLLSGAGGTTQYYPPHPNIIYLRYGCFAMFAGLLYLTHKLLKTETFKSVTISKVYVGCIIHIFILTILSNELININVLHNFNITDSYYQGTNAAYKLGFTSLWGIYSFIMIAWGIFKKNRIMRITAISLFGITLVKLVTFDTWDLSTGYKVIAFILLGVILLTVAFLYQKFKTLIFGDDPNEASQS